MLEIFVLSVVVLTAPYNGEILHRQFWDQTEIQEGDCLEVVTIVGGG